MDLGGASRSSSAMFGAYRYSAEDDAGASAADEADSSFSTRSGDGSDGSSGGGVARVDAQLDGSPFVQGLSASLQLPRSPLDFGGISAEAGRPQPVSGGRLPELTTAEAEHAADAVPPASRDVPQHTASKSRRDAALAAYVATQLKPQG